jgi:hypothetical protein
MMKKLTMFLFLLILPISLMAQVVNPTIDLNGYFETLGSIASLTVIVSMFLIDRVFKIAVKWAKMAITWVIAILLTIGATLLNVGFTAEFPIFTSLAYGFGAGLVANGLFDVSLVQAFLEMLKLKKTKEEKTTEALKEQRAHLQAK